MLAVPAPRPLREGEPSPRRQEILDGLEALILQQGFRSLRLTEVGKQLGTSYATLYQIAASKDELITLVIERFYQRNIARALHVLTEQSGPVERLECWTGFGIDGVGATARQFWIDVDSHPPIRSRIAIYSHYYVEVLAAIIDDGIERGAFRSVNARLLAMAWEATTITLGDPAVGDERSLRQLAEDWVDIVLHGLLPSSA